MQRLEVKSRKKEEAVTRTEEEVSRGQKAIMKVGEKEVGQLDKLDKLPEALMEDYNRCLDSARKMMEEMEEAKRVVTLHARNVALGYVK